MRAVLLILLLCACVTIRITPDGETRVRSMGAAKVVTRSCEIPPSPALPDRPAADPIVWEQETASDRICVQVDGSSTAGAVIQRVVEGVLIATIMRLILAI